MPIIFEVKAYNNKRIRLTDVQQLHMLFFHPEVEGEQEKMRRCFKEPRDRD